MLWNNFPSKILANFSNNLAKLISKLCHNLAKKPRILHESDIGQLHILPAQDPMIIYQAK